ncbi:hypothetical protein K438DRAFT_1760947 [Mycena galopus ATCC 62051]|nr:hypothetical protein K438DRAFT_1760947 [Mycena galopus ATCC 62051]
MAITETQKSRTICARDKSPPLPTAKARAKPGPKLRNGPHTAAHFEKDQWCQDLTYHDKDSTAASSLPAPIANDRQLKEAESAFANAIQTLCKQRCLRGEDASMNELLNPQIEQEDLDSVFLRFAEGDDGTCEILAVTTKRKTRKILRSRNSSLARRRPWTRSLSFRRLRIIGQIWIWLCHLSDISTNSALHSPRKLRRGRITVIWNTLETLPDGIPYERLYCTMESQITPAILGHRALWRPN